MGTFSKLNLTINNFVSPITYKVGRGKGIQEKETYNFYDNKLRFLNNSFNCSVYTVTSPLFLPNLSVQYYGTSSLWWVIAKFNGIIYPLREITVGKVLYIPDLGSISKFLNKDKDVSTGANTKRVTF